MKKPANSVKVVHAVFAYTSDCCEAPAAKPPCAVERGQHVGMYLGSKPAGEATLGSWRCTNCRKPCSVSRGKKAEAAIV